MPSFPRVDDIRESATRVKKRIRCFLVHHARHSFFIVGILSILWLIFRSGTKPSRITYPCQQLAATAGSLWYVSYIVPVLAILALRKRYVPHLKGMMIIAAVCSLAAVSVFIILPSPVSSSDLYEALGAGTDLSLPFSDSVASETSRVFVVNGRSDPAGIQDLIDGMGTRNVLFYNSSTPGKNAGLSGLIGKEDTVLIKVNCQWEQRGGTDTDVVKGLIQAIVDHPDGFAGEIVIADNGQGRGSFTWANANAQDHTQSIQKVVDSFSGRYNVSTFLWDPLRDTEVVEYDQGNSASGYIVNHTANPRTGIHVSYPIFTTSYGTNISLKKGIWKNGVYDNTRLKFINVPVLKTHGSAGVTGCMKHFVGVLSVPKTDGLTPVKHGWINTGGLGTEMAESRIPDLNILDATWVNAIPKGNTGNGPGTPYQRATYLNTLVAGTDPVAIDYYGAKYLLMPAATARGYTDLSTMNPDSGAPNTFGAWLKLSRNELLLAGHPATVNESQMEVIPINVPSIGSVSPDYGTAGSRITITNLSGTNFQPGVPGTVVHLSRAGHSIINATSVRVISAARINCTLVLPTDAGAPGRWNVTVINPDGRSATLVNGFTIRARVVPASQVGVFRPSVHRFLLRNGSATTLVSWGVSTDIPVSGDWNGDGVDDVGVFRNSTHRFHLKNGTADTIVSWGVSTDIPVSGDWNGDGVDDIGVFRNSTHRFHLKNGTADTIVSWGVSTDIPVSGDWNGDGVDDVGVFRPLTHTFILKNGSATTTIDWGQGTDLPVTGRWG
jgi:hypothetical protein